MTEAFEKWVNQVEPLRIAHDPHFWLRAFVKEVERRTDGYNSHADLGLAFERVVQDFGLEDKSDFPIGLEKERT